MHVDRGGEGGAKSSAGYSLTTDSYQLAMMAFNVEAYFCAGVKRHVVGKLEQYVDFVP